MIFNPSNDATAAAIGKFCNVPSAMIPFLSSSLIFAIFDTRLIPRILWSNLNYKINDDLKISTRTSFNSIGTPIARINVITVNSFLIFGWELFAFSEIIFYNHPNNYWIKTRYSNSINNSVESISTCTPTLSLNIDATFNQKGIVAKAISWVTIYDVVRATLPFINDEYIEDIWPPVHTLLQLFRLLLIDYQWTNL